MDWATFLGGILGATFGSVITGIVSFKITNKTIKADLKKTEQEIKSKFYIEVTAQSKQDWLDLLREKIAKLASTTLQINLYSYDSNKNIVDNLNVFSDLVSIFDFHQAFIKLMLIDENNENYDFNELINSMNIIEMNIPDLARILPRIYSNKINGTELVQLLENKRNINLEIHKQVLSVINIGKMILKKETNKKEDIMKSITQSL